MPVVEINLKQIVKAVKRLKPEEKVNFWNAVSLKLRRKSDFKPE